MTREEILDRIEACSWRERRREGLYVCSRYIYTNVPCNGACSWVFDYPKIKEFEKKKKKKKKNNKLLHKKN